MSNLLTKVYIGKPKDLEYVPILYPNLGIDSRIKNSFYIKAFELLQNPVLEIVDDPSLADFFLFPHNYFLIKSDEVYVNDFISYAEGQNKKVILFAYGDSSESINLRNTIVFRVSQYKSLKKDNEIIMPGYAEDLIGAKELSYREKGEIATIGFCGWASFSSVSRYIKYIVKVFLIDLKALFALNQKLKVVKQGIYFRRKALGILNRSKKVVTNFIIRASYSGNRKTILLDPQKAKNDFFTNTLESDFVLCPKGDGNFSLRFYEVLSMGRIPLLIDTDSVLPLEDKIDYKKCVLTVDYKDIDSIAEIVNKFYKECTPDMFLNMQKNAREVFVNYLRIDSFFRFYFVTEEGKENLRGTNTLS